MCKAAVSKSKKSAGVGRNPKIRLSVFRQRPNTRIRKAFLFRIGRELFPVINRQATIATYPESAVVAWQHCHGDIAKQPISLGEHVHDARFEVNQSVSICANPEPTLAVGVETARKDIGNGGILNYVSHNAIYTGSQNGPYITIPVFIGPESRRCRGAKRAQPRQALLASSQKPFVRRIPHRASVVLELFKDIGLWHT